ncbi:hypothetical protein GH714_037996 [Hevea brasiliensis]|uniref:LisH domain-containing protein n=1 Tax=Hevea brasiliensis TaxID=3981 RepID=A0A6A6L4X7_HEVBR|nr:hypothetical protein GH714_037996 [Hevea brasiliensis]
MGQNNWEADKMLDVYIHDYLLKRKLHNSAKAFMTEGKVATDPVAIDAPGGFLFEWWSVFWDIFIARTNEKHSEAAAAYIEAQQIKAREQQHQLQMQQLQLMQHRNARLQHRDPNHPALAGSINTINSEGMMGQPSASVLAMKMYEERIKHPHSMESETSPTLIDANRVALFKTATNQQGQLVQVNSGNMSAALQQIQARTPLTTDIKSEVNLLPTQKSLPMDPSSMYGQAILQSKAGLGGAGLNQGLTGLPLKGWPLTAQAPSSLGNSSNFGDMDPRRLNQLPRGSLNTKDGQSTRNDGSMCSPVQSSSPKMKMAQMQHSPSQQQDQLQQQQQLQQGNRKRKQHSSSGAANSTGTGNTVGPSPSSPPSTHTPGDGITTASSLQHVNSVSKGLMMYGPEGTGGLASSSNMLEDMDRFGDIASLDDNAEQFLPHDGVNGSNLYGTLKHSSTEHQKASTKGFTFDEVGCIRTRNSKVTCCHFSSDGKLLASAGHDKKVVLWNMDTLQTENTPEEHKLVITDVRFRPNSSQLATASVDKSVRLWDAANGHSEMVNYICWDANGDILASVSQNLVKIWSLASGSAFGSLVPMETSIILVFPSKLFDSPGDRRNLASLVMGNGCLYMSMPTLFSTLKIKIHDSGFLQQSLELWNIAENKRMTISAHENIISALAQSPVAGMVASASHDTSVKLWK